MLRRGAARADAGTSRRARASGLLAGAAEAGQAQQAVVVDQVDAEPGRREQPLAAVEDLVEHRLRVGHRAADDLQHLGGRGLLLERLLGLVEQARVLDRDHRLVGERAQQADLLVGEAGRRLARSRRSRRCGALPTPSARTPARRCRCRCARRRRGSRAARRRHRARRGCADRAALEHRLGDSQPGERRPGTAPRSGRGPGLDGRRDAARPSSPARRMPCSRAREQVLAALEDLLEHRLRCRRPSR